MASRVPHRMPENFHRAATPEEAVAALDRLHQAATGALREALARYETSGEKPSAEQRAQFRYPELRVTYQAGGEELPANRRAFAKFPAAGVYNTTVTQPAAFRKYLLEQLNPLVAEFGAVIEVGPGGTEIPYPYVFESGD